MIKVAIKYCGGCNPDYDRVALVEEIKIRLDGRVEFVSFENDSPDIIMAVEGCQTACADLTAFEGAEIFIINNLDDADRFVLKLKK